MASARCDPAPDTELPATDLKRFYALDDMETAALNTGDLELARQYAEELVRAASIYPGDWNYGNAIHKGNTTLGLVALKSGDIENARRYLLLSGQTPGSPQLDTFGPNMSLALELLSLGEDEVVLHYLGLCKRFWEFGVTDGSLDRWMAQIRRGEIPNFGANLLF